jgi:hypothetical protein
MQLADVTGYPLALAADVQDGPTDMAALMAGLDHQSYSFLSKRQATTRTAG